MEAREKVDAPIQRRVPHQVRNGPMKLQSRMIQIFPILYTDQIRRLNRIERTRAMPRNDARGHYFVNRGQILDRHFVQPDQWVRSLGETGEESSFETPDRIDRTYQSGA